MIERLDMQILLNDEKTKELLTEILIDLIKTRKELFAEIFQDALEEVGFGNAIAEGRKNEFVSEENIFALLDGDVE
jgi:restriction endonuclease Mrr